MTSSFSSLPLIDLSILSSQSPSPQELKDLSTQLHDVFATTGFAYLTNAPLSFSHDDVFRLSNDFFSIEDDAKARLAKKTFVSSNKNTYRGYFPTQPGQQDNLKEGFEIGPPVAVPSKACSKAQKFDLAEPNVWPEEETFLAGRARVESLYNELQKLSSSLLSLVAISLDKPADFFIHYLVDSLSTLRLLHYPPQDTTQHESDETKLCCTPHTDSGILTLLHQDPTGGLEVRNSDREWVPVPYVPGSIVVNIGDLLASVSGGRFVATMHRVRTSSSQSKQQDDVGRFSVPFFFEPGQECVVSSVGGGEGVVYGEYVRKKMSTWIEYQDSPLLDDVVSIDRSAAIEA